jgi:hypothetical protein
MSTAAEPTGTRAQRLAAVIMASRQPRVAPKSSVVECHACGFALSADRALINDDRHHCSPRCRQWTESGNPSYAVRNRFDPFAVTWGRPVAGPDPGYLPKVSMRQGSEGFFIHCRACGHEFESKGWAYCGDCMQLPPEERRAMQPSVRGRICQAPQCENPVPRRSRAGARFCSSACRQRAYRDEQRLCVTDNCAVEANTATPDFVTDNGKKSQ